MISKKQKTLKRCMLAVLLLLIPSMLYAACTGSSPTWITTPDYASVNTCVQGASAGDTVNVTAGDGSETWNSTLNIPRNINLVGPGRDSLVITLGVSNDYNIKTGVWSGGSISGFEFLTTADYSGVILRGTGWRIHHNRYRNELTGSANGVFVWASGSDTTTTPEGLIDNNEVINGKTIVTGGGNFNNESTHWASASTIGTEKTVYIEDNVFSMTWNGGSNCTDANRSGRYVFRYNNFLC